MRELADFAAEAASPSGLTGHSIWIAAVVTLAFATLARALRGVTSSGAVAGGLVCFLLYVTGGPGAFAALVSVFALTWVATRFGYSRKQKLGTAEKGEGRNAWQVLANLAAAAVSTAFYSVNHQPAFLVGAAAALSEAAADTVSSEFGKSVSKTARLITNWKSVPAGTDGGVTLLGTLAGAVAAALVGLVCVSGGFLPAKWLAVSVLAGLIGTVTDSYMGAWFEQRQMLSNDQINFLATMVAALSAMLMT
jgi:uncharacterized protein (TIGR00297 family)